MDTVNRYQVNISKIAGEAVFEALQAKIEAEHALELQHNEQLREQVRHLEELLREKHRKDLTRVLMR